MVPCALVEGHDVASESLFRLAFVLELLKDRGARGVRFLDGLRVFNGVLHLFRDVDDLLEHDQLQTGTFEFVFKFFGAEAVLDVVALFRAQRGDGRQTDVMVRQNESGGGDEGRAAGICELQARFLQMFEEFRLEFDAVLSRLAACASFSGGKERALNLEPSNNPIWVEEGQRELFL